MRAKPALYICESHRADLCLRHVLIVCDVDCITLWTFLTGLFGVLNFGGFNFHAVQM